MNYDAGTWTQAEINAIQTGEKGNLVKANGNTSLPSTNFQFGGFTAGSSRNGNVAPFIYISSYNYYVKDTSTGNSLTGWRVFDIEGDKVTLISAGNPEDYYHPYDRDTYRYISEYILSGNINSSWSTSEASNYQKRNWSNYINTNQGAQNATVLTKSRLDSWYSKYIESGADTYTHSTFQKIYETSYVSYQNVVDNFSYYWLSAAHDSGGLNYVNPRTNIVRNAGLSKSYAFGVRILVTLSSDVKFTATPTGTKIVTGGNTATYGGDQTYNCWEIK